MQYDLEERVAKFGESMIIFCKKLEKNEITRPLIGQIIRSGTSVGANYMEAVQSASKKDFRNKIKICQKEANETKHWLRMIALASSRHVADCRIIWREAHELVLIFAKISKNCNID